MRELTILINNILCRNNSHHLHSLRHADLILVHVPQSGDSGKLTEKTPKVSITIQKVT